MVTCIKYCLGCLPKHSSQSHPYSLSGDWQDIHSLHPQFDEAIGYSP